MSEFKGTPWKVETFKDDSNQISEIYIFTENNACILCVNDGDDNYDIESDLANAQLWAAAPDLLMGLQEALNIFKPYMESRGEIGDMQIKRWEHFISKALGKENQTNG